MSEVSLVVAEGQVPDHVKKATGRGNEDVSADHLTIPRLRQLQSISNEVDKHHPDYQEDANVGDFINFLTKDNYGSEVYVISVKFKENFVVWRKRTEGGGLHGSFESQALAKASLEEAGEAEKYDINQTHEHLLLVVDPKTGTLSTPVLMDFAVSKLRASRDWNSQIAQKGGDRFSGLWKVVSIPKENRNGQKFMALKIEWVGWVTKDNYDVAEAVFNQFQSQ